MWRRPPIPLRDAHRVPWRPVPGGELGRGGAYRDLSVDESDGACSRLVRIETPQHGRLMVGADLYVVRGRGQWGPHPLEEDRYVYVPAGSDISIEPGPSGMVLFCAFSGTPEVATPPSSSLPGGGATPIDVAGLAWEAPPWSSGSATADVFTKWLRRGDDAHVFLSAMLPGRHTRREEAHPVAEETFRLAGEVLQAGDGVSTPGSYCFRPPGFWHGPLGTPHGTLALVRSSGPITTEFRDPPPDRDWDTVRERYGPARPPAAWD